LAIRSLSMSLPSATSEVPVMTKVIVYTRPDGEISVCHPLISRDDPPGFTIEEAVARALSKDVPSTAITVAVIEKMALPADRSFRAAWRQRGQGVSVDIASARDIHLARLRLERDAKLAATDGLMARATERGDAAERSKLAARRQALRDMPADAATALAAVETLEDLKAVRPAVLDEQP
jgi:hypothetical protein